MNRTKKVKNYSLHQIENNYSIKFPSIFRNSSDDKEMEWLSKDYSWIRANISRLTKGSNYFFSGLGDCEFIPFQYYSKWIKELIENIDYDIKQKGDTVKLNRNYRMIPFAHMASGDLYCFLYNEKEGNKEPAIVVYGHDTGDVDLWADSFEEFLYYQTISEVLDWEGDIGDKQIKCNISLLGDEYRKRLMVLKEDEIVDIIPVPKPIDIFIEDI